ncbi:MAG: TSUP family transporter [Gammaproteobacteria bacterium]|nr:TSUP family transporter [Gammaproteobacteria bacterium]
MFELLANIPWEIILASAAFVAGFIDAIVGGGGLLTVPALLSSGLPVHMVLGTNKLASTFGTATSSLTFYRNKLFDPKMWLPCIIATFIGALLGAVAVSLVSGAWLEKILPLIIISTAIYTLFKQPGKTIDTKVDKNCIKFKFKQRAQGLILGFYDGFAGPGTGAFWTVSTQILHKFDLLISSGVARTMNFVSNATALVTFMILGQVDYELGLLMGGFLMIGAYIGAQTAIKFGGKLIRPLFIIVVLVISAKLAWNAWF